MKPFFKPIPLLLLVFSAWITWVCATLLQFDDRGNLFAHSYSVWGDWSAHITFISGLKERGVHWLVEDTPLFPGAPFQYPFLSHVITALFSGLFGLEVITATRFLSLALIFVLPFILYRLFCRLGQSTLSAFFATLSFLLIGGFQWLDSSLNAREPLTNQFNQGSLFTQFILFELYPQRAFSFGLVGFGLFFLWALRARQWKRGHVVALAFGLALFALLHIHTWIATALFLLSLWALPEFANRRFPRLRMFQLGLLTAVFSLGFLSFLLLRGDHSHILRSWQWWYPGWAQNSQANLPVAASMNFFTFWIYNTALYLPLALLGIYLARNEKSLRPFALSGLSLFTLACLFNAQPYFYDNLKLFTYAFFFLAPFVGCSLARILEITRLPRPLRLILAVSIFGIQIAAGTQDLWSFQNGLQTANFFTSEEFTLAEDFKKIRASAEDIVLINPRHNHWVPCLTGNPVALGYPGWLWSWGISYTDREKTVQEIFQGLAGSDSALKELHVKYIALQAHDQIANHPLNVAFFEANFKRVLTRGDWIVYSTRDRKSPSTAVQ